MTNLVLAVVIVAIVGAAIAKIVAEKRRGVKCIGCPEGGSESCCHCSE